MTNDIGQRDEWDFDHSMDWHLLNYEPHQQLNYYFRGLNSMYRENRAFFELDFKPEGFEWIDFSDSESSVVSFIRWSRDRKQVLLVTCNMTPVPRHNYRTGVPLHGHYEEILNSDAKEFGGGGIGNCGGFHSERQSWHGRPYSLNLTLPPLAINIFRMNVTES